jgi:hypothetical protein
MFGDKRTLVRFEADGYTMDQADDYDTDDDGGGVPVSATSVEHDLADTLCPEVLPPAAGDVAVLSRGSPTAQSSTIEIRTRSVRKQRNNVMFEQVPRLWLRQMENIVLSFHDNGRFGSAVVEDVCPMILE